MTTTITSSELLEQMSELRMEPTRLQGLLHAKMEAVFDGEEMHLDPSLPFPFLLEASVVMTAAAIEEDQNLNARQYPVMATTEDDLYHHLADVDYEGMFGSPAGGWFTLYLSKEEVLARAARVGNTSTKKLTLPKHSQIVVNGATFTFQYPINLIVKSHGGLDVVYDGSRPSPLQTIRGNKVDWQTVKTPVVTEGQSVMEFVAIRIFLKQMLLTSYTFTPSAAQILKKTFPLIDSYYYTRCFYKAANDEWVEMGTTHSQQVFDPTVPTMLLKVIDNELTVELPHVYSLTQLVTRDIRVDVYTTKGPLTMPLAELPSNSFVATWRDLDNDDAGVYSAPMSVMSTISIFSDDTVTGGAAAPTFEERRNNVMNNSVKNTVIPISDAQVGNTLAKLGFDAFMNVDLLTQRTYLATRAMPPATDSLASTGVDAAVLTMRATVNDIITLDTVIDNGDRITITPKTLYRNQDGVLTMVSDGERQEIDNLNGEAKVNRVSDGTYLSTPLHYVLDLSDDQFEVRPYYLNNPSIESSSYIASNDTTGLTITSGSLRGAIPNETGYVIQVVSSSNSVWKALRDDQVHVQLAILPEGEEVMAYINGVQVGKTGDGERIFEFTLETDWDINVDHKLGINSFAIYEPGGKLFFLPLESEYSLLWSVSDYGVAGMETSEVDQSIGKFLLPLDSVGVYHETIHVVLGAELTGLWARSRSMIGERKYLTYQSPVPLRYEKNIYEIDPATNLPKIIDGPNGRELVIQHRKDDIVLNMDGEPVIKHFVGDAVLDEHGNPIPESERTVTRWWDMVLFDGVYRYATSVADSTYYKSVPDVMVDWINDTLADVRERTLERTTLLFQPRNTLKWVDVLVNDGETKTIHTAQRLTIDLFVNKEVYDDSELRAALTEATKKQAIASLDAIVVSRDGIQKSINTAVGNDVISVKVSGLGGINNDFDVITLLDESSRLCMAKSLLFGADSTYLVIDSIEINFRRHAER